MLPQQERQSRGSCIGTGEARATDAPTHMEPRQRRYSVAADAAH